MNKPVALVCLMLLLAISAAAQKEWVGTYAFDEDGGKNAGGTVIFIAHQLTVMEADDGFIAHLESNGYQTSKDLNCRAKVNGSKLEIYFDSYGENNIFETYEKGDLLLTLERRAVKGKQELITFWGKFTPVVPKNEKTGKSYFVKASKIDTN
jgi:hypothetical protein